jgi:hypothetical protein
VTWNFQEYFATLRRLKHDEADKSAFYLENDPITTVLLA